MKTCTHIFVKGKPISNCGVLQWGVLSEEFKQAEILGQMNLCMHAHLLSHVQLFVTPWTPEAHQGPLSMGFSRQEYWSGLPCPPLGDLPHPGIEPATPASPSLQEDSLLLSHCRSPNDLVVPCEKQGSLRKPY